MHETPNVPGNASRRERSQMFSSPPYHSIPHEWSIHLTLQSPPPCSLSRSTPSARPSPSIITPPNQGWLPPRKGESRLIGNRIWFAPAVLSDWEYWAWEQLSWTMIDSVEIQTRTPLISNNCLTSLFLLSTTATGKDGCLSSTSHSLPADAKQV